MSGWEKVAAATVLALVALVWVNIAIWRRLRAPSTQRTSAVEVEKSNQGLVE